VLCVCRVCEWICTLQDCNIHTAKAARVLRATAVGKGRLCHVCVGCENTYVTGWRRHIGSLILIDVAFITS